ncbi:hypothetical protein DDZ18_05575 [Marinicauda salina]|uniref:Uncharacterized protein n=2 Tax=Marinicauda salina TaxID=2135793 RepID=A0A2U2BUW3_9PROT|nr:hypothetical protein DDZ18_05575 [Marinicauda salina]
MFEANLAWSERRALLEASTMAWVFGGMGSWNDFYPSEEKAAEYERVSEALYRAIQDAQLAAVNAEI